MPLFRVIIGIVSLLILGCSSPPTSNSDKRSAELEEDGAISSPTEITGGYLVKLNIIDGSTNQPVPDAIVYQYGFQARKKTANKQGQLSYTVDPSPPANATVDWTGWQPAFVVVGNDSSGAKIAAFHQMVQSQAQDMTIRLFPVGAIQGKAQKEGETDHTGVDVFFPGTDLSAKTSSSGDYAIFEVPPGSWPRLVAQHQGYDDAEVKSVSVASKESTTVETMNLTIDTGIKAKVTLGGGEDEFFTLTIDIAFDAPEATLYRVTEGEIAEAAWLPMVSALSYQFSVGGDKVLSFQFSNDNGLTGPIIKKAVRINVGNQVPTLDLGKDRVGADKASEGELVLIDGSSAKDPEGGQLTYLWEVTKVTGGFLTIVDINLGTPTQNKTSFTAPQSIGDYTLTISLKVTDPAGGLATDTIEVEVDASNGTPTAVVAPSQTVLEGNTVTLDGSASQDAELDASELLYSWEKVSVSGGGVSLGDIALSSNTAAKPTFVAPQTSASYTVIFRLVVSDGALSSSSVTHVVTVEPLTVSLAASSKSEYSCKFEIPGTASLDHGGVYHDATVIKGGGSTGSYHSASADESGMNLNFDLSHLVAGNTLALTWSVETGPTGTGVAAATRTYTWNAEELFPVPDANRIPARPSGGGEAFDCTPPSGIAATRYNTCFIDGNKRIKCWGSEETGIRPSYAVSSDESVDTIPVLDASTPGLTVRTLIESSLDSMCAITENFSLYCWGSNANKLVGLDATGTVYAPTQVSEFDGSTDAKRVVTVSNDYLKTCLTTKDGKAYCTGNRGEDYGGIGNGAFSSDSSDGFEPVVGIGTGGLENHARAISVGVKSVNILMANGAIKSFGKDINGSLGHGVDDIHSATPKMNALFDGSSDAKKAVQVVTGEDFSCALSATAKVLCWGNQSTGNPRLGNGGFFASNTPVAVASTVIDGVTAGKKAVAIDANGRTACLLTDTHHLYCWGNGDLGKLGGGAGQTAHKENPTLVDSSEITGGSTLDKKVVAFDVGHRHVCAIMGDGKINCWGSNEKHNLGVAHAVVDASTASPTIREAAATGVQVSQPTMVLEAP